MWLILLWELTKSGFLMNQRSTPKQLKSRFTFMTLERGKAPLGSLNGFQTTSWLLSALCVDNCPGVWRFQWYQGLWPLCCCLHLRPRAPCSGEHPWPRLWTHLLHRGPGWPRWWAALSLYTASKPDRRCSFLILLWHLTFIEWKHLNSILCSIGQRKNVVYRKMCFYFLFK